MASKNYYHRTPHSTYICTKGVVHSFDGSGKLVTEDTRVQGELEAAIKSGAQFRTQEMVDAEKAAAVKAAQPAAPAAAR